MTNKERVWELRQLYPGMRAIRISEELNITRERVRQILVSLKLETDIKYAPAKQPGPSKAKRTRDKRSIRIPKFSLEPMDIPGVLPKICSKCSGHTLYKEYCPEGGWELKCFTCGKMVAFGW